MKREYTCTITSNYSYGREYTVKTASAMKCAEMYGRGESGEIVTVRTKTGKPVSRVAWTQHNGGRHVRVLLPND